MKSEIIKYNSLIKAIKPRPQRLDANEADTFSLLSFWRANEDEVPAFSYVLRAVLANAPNSIPPERVFSVLNDTFDDDQCNSMADYIARASLRAIAWTAHGARHRHICMTSFFSLLCRQYSNILAILRGI